MCYISQASALVASANCQKIYRTNTNTQRGQRKESQDSKDSQDMQEPQVPKECQHPAEMKFIDAANSGQEIEVSAAQRSHCYVPEKSPRGIQHNSFGFVWDKL